MSAVGSVSSVGGAFAVQALPKKSVKSVPEMAFGKASWEKYFDGDVGIEPILPPNIEEILNSPCPFWVGKKVKETHLLTLIPEKVDGDPYTLNRLSELIQRPKTGYSTTYHYYDHNVKNELGNEKVSTCYWVLLTREVLPKSRNKTYETQKQLVASHPAMVGELYTLPTALETTTSVLMEHVKNGTKLLPLDPQPTLAVRIR